MEDTSRPTGLYHIRWEEHHGYSDDTAIYSEEEGDGWYMSFYNHTYKATDDTDAKAKVFNELKRAGSIMEDTIFTAYREEFDPKTYNLALIYAFTEENL